MKVAEYRDLISACWDRLNSVKSAATPHEQRVETQSLANAVEELAAAHCRFEQDRAERCLAACRSAIEDKRAQFRAADAAFQKMAFGEEWR